MIDRRPKSPGSFQDELTAVIERIAPDKSTAQRKPEELATEVAELNDRLFERAWWRPR